MHSSQGYAQRTLILLTSGDLRGKTLIGIPPSLRPCSLKCRWLFLPLPAHPACPVLCTQPVKAAHKAHHQLCKILQDIAGG